MFDLLYRFHIALYAMEGLVSFSHVFALANLSLLFLLGNDNIEDPEAVVIRVKILNVVFFFELRRWVLSFFW